MAYSLPKTPTEVCAFSFLLFSIHAVLFFEINVVLPFCYRDVSRDAKYYFHLLAAFFIYANVMCNLWKLITTDSSSVGLVLPVLLKPGWRFCSVCECNSPPRSFHCHSCKKCILKRDHHCLFIGNCIGYNNHRYFVLVIFYIWLAAVYANVMNIDFIFHIFESFSLRTIFSLFLPFFAWCLGVVHTMTLGSALMITLCLIGVSLTTVLLGYHMNNIVKGQTVYENTYSITEYDLGWKENLKIVFGKKWYIAWVFPLVSSPLLGNGMEFISKKTWESLKNM